MNEFIEIGDLVRIVTDTSLLKADGTEIRVLGSEGYVTYICKGADQQNIYIVEIDGIGCILLDRDIHLMEKGAKEALDHHRYIDEDTYHALKRIGILDTSVRSYHIGASDYSQHVIQPWSIWQDYNLNAWDADIVKRVLRTKEGESRRTDYEKIIHICEERIRQIDNEK